MPFTREEGERKYILVVKVRGGPYETGLAGEWRSLYENTRTKYETNLIMLTNFLKHEITSNNLIICQLSVLYLDYYNSVIF